MTASLLQPAIDDFQRVHRLNIAAAIALSKSGELSAAAKSVSCSALMAIARRYADEPARWSEVGDYLQIEKLMVEVGGWPITELHSGRSRQDMGATTLRMAWRQRTIDAVQSAGKMRRALQRMAGDNPHALLPAYTWGVQAQPTTLGHYLLGYSHVLARWQSRMSQAYERINLSPLGGCVLGTSLFAFDRTLLASLLGFSGPISNSFDAVQLATADVAVEIAGHINTLTCGLSLLYADITAQYHHAEPWLILGAGNVGGSSAMPQKRNPMVISALRRQQNALAGEAMTILLNAHNVPSGMHDYKHHDATKVLERAALLLDESADMVHALEFVPATATAEIERDYASATDLAHMLQINGVPFRLAHACVASLVTHARSSGVPLSQVDAAQLRRIVKEHVTEDHYGELARRWDEIRQATNAEWIVSNRKGLGGPQPASVEAMLADDVHNVEHMENWAAQRTAELAKADEMLCASFRQMHKELLN